jgi:hypothetical protein
MDRLITISINNSDRSLFWWTVFRKNKKIKLWQY